MASDFSGFLGKAALANGQPDEDPKRKDWFLPRFLIRPFAHLPKVSKTVDTQHYKNITSLKIERFVCFEALRFVKGSCTFWIAANAFEAFIGAQPGDEKQDRIWCEAIGFQADMEALEKKLIPGECLLL